MDQAFQIAGALLVLGAFLALQRDWLAPPSLVYIGLNLVGSVILTVVALIGSDWGFLLLAVEQAPCGNREEIDVARARKVIAEDEGTVEDHREEIPS